jgi:hypothetical protein
MAMRMANYIDILFNYHLRRVNGGYRKLTTSQFYGGWKVKKQIACHESVIGNQGHKMKKGALHGSNQITETTPR